MDKRKYIYNTINTNIINTKLIIDFVERYNIKYTENSNGIFINISTIDSEYIDLLYDLINKNILVDYKEYTVPEIIKTQNAIETPINNYSNLLIKDDIDIEIIELSKLI